MWGVQDMEVFGTVAAQDRRLYQLQQLLCDGGQSQHLHLEKVVSGSSWWKGM
jgi:hypothetical protein